MPADNSFEHVMAGLRAGDADAAAQVFRRFADRLIALARSRLSRRLRAKVDPEDVLQSVCKSFFLRHAEGQFDLKDWDSLWSLLTVIAVRKCGRWQEHFHTQGRALAAEVSAQRAGEGSAGSWEALAREPSPAEAAMLAETVEQLLGQQEGRDREIVSLRLQGYTAVEISEQLSRPERTVYRVLAHVRKRLMEMQAEGAEPL
jgi:RNA polymerase sigma-70 factor, ECF subfamily